MKTKIVMALSLSLLMFCLPVSAAQVQNVKKIADGEYDLVIDGVRVRAYSAEQLRNKLKVMSELKAQIEALEKLKGAQQGMIDGQRAQLDRMDAQLQDYRTLNTKLEQILKLSPGFSASAGMGYLGSELTGMLGIGYGDWRIMGLLQPSSAGFMLSKDF